MFHVKQFILGFCFQNVSRETFLFFLKILFKRFVVQFPYSFNVITLLFDAVHLLDCLSL